MTENIDMELIHAFRKASRKMRMAHGPQRPPMESRLHPEMEMHPHFEGRRIPAHPDERHAPEGQMEKGRRPRPHLHREIILSIILDHENEGIHQKDLTKEFRINPSSVSESIDKLEDSGYLKRITDPQDHRATLLVLTDLGKARALEIKDQRSAHMEMLFGKLTEEEKEQLLVLLNKMIQD